jgi:hypothetical protein
MLLLLLLLLFIKSRGTVDIATGYGMDDWGVGVRVPVELRILISPYRSDRRHAVA